jgi:hypothetical protein
VAGGVEVRARPGWDRGRDPSEIRLVHGEIRPDKLRSEFADARLAVEVEEPMLAAMVEGRPEEIRSDVILGVRLLREHRGDHLASEDELVAGQNVGDHQETVLAKVSPHRVRILVIPMSASTSADVGNRLAVASLPGRTRKRRRGGSGLLAVQEGEHGLTGGVGAEEAG